MQPHDYIVKSISGEYCILHEINDNSEIFIALALLPEGTDEGVRLHYENFEYEITG